MQPYLICFALLVSGWSLSFAAPGDPQYMNHPAPFPQCGGDAAEPSIGVNRSTGKIMLQAGLETLQVSFDDTTSPPVATWLQKQPLITSLFSLDPILYTDSQTGRTIVSQLSAGCSLAAWSDNDGELWNLSLGCGIPAGLDHQTVGGGPYAPFPQISHPNYPNAVYYCSQTLLLASCARSDDGGFLFGLSIPIYLFSRCNGRHGHLKVAPDGTVYVPNASCSGKQGIAVSENNGITWNVRTVPGTGAGFSDPSIAIGASNSVYLAFEDSNHRMKVAVSHNRGVNWVNVTDVGAAFGIQNSVFPAAVAGDNNRAAVAFLGTTTPGNYENSSFAGIWHLYVASTFDGGQTWTLVNLTPDDPVQVGSIQAGGALTPSARRLTVDMSVPLLDRGDRNLLDFIDADVDEQGRVVVAYADGCVGECVTNPTSDLSRSALGTIARQSGGKRMYAAFDPVEIPCPTVAHAVSIPMVTLDANNNPVLHIQDPQNPGSTGVTGYNVYRDTVPNPTIWTRIATNVVDMDAGVVNFQYVDQTASGDSYYYKVAAYNATCESEGPL